jgi:glyoxylase-like metal-dependent hydrolase (beta-lactamase superfamily II)
MDECVVIDPSVALDTALKSVSSHGNDTKIIAVLLTHGHYDHMIELDSYINAGIPIYLSQKDSELLADPWLNCSMLFGLRKSFVGANLIFVNDNDVIQVGDEKIKVMLTPGHTEGALAYFGNGYVFAGDTIFPDGGYGRADLPTGDRNKLLSSIGKILALPENTVIYTGHMSCTTVLNERKYNILYNQ